MSIYSKIKTLIVTKKQIPKKDTPKAEIEIYIQSEMSKHKLDNALQYEREYFLNNWSNNE